MELHRYGEQLLQGKMGICGSDLNPKQEKDFGSWSRPSIDPKIGPDSADFSKNYQV